ncbi:nucleotide-diphospho-sugar transferase [Dactylonectria macrodidyma]|uniref:Nucleotide-diphospho-sugar transferase n=1 Tax=Dactylonectria macrodidyma TaxID=307937 RepID=A0A9P9JHT2_9HYPO|nr:nucleotide-diphospho-sugar transferase [Dactylonectria macrodidyma]
MLQHQPCQSIIEGESVSEAKNAAVVGPRPSHSLVVSIRKAAFSAKGDMKNPNVSRPPILTELDCQNGISEAMASGMPTSSRPGFSSWLPPIFLIGALTLSLTLNWCFIDNTWTKVFWTIFIFRYTRLIVQPDPAFSRSDVTVILPTIDPNGPDFQECIRSILRNQPSTILVVTVGQKLRNECQAVLQQLHQEAQSTRIAVTALPQPSKRRQISHAIPHVDTPITILADDHVFWPSENFIPSVLAPFENQAVGVFATKKRVRRTTPGQWNWPSIVNFIACNYLQRHNWELRASNAIDGGVFVVSSRTAVYRTEFFEDKELLERVCNEKFFFGLFGGGEGLGPDHDNFLTREILKKGWLIRFQDTEDAIVETTLGEWPKFRGQLIRWARTTFRSNPAMLRDPSFLGRYFWSAFMVYWAGIVNFALLWDALLIGALVKSTGTGFAELMLLLIWIFFTKMIKIIPNLCRDPSDFSLVICQIAFAYIHSFIKLWALVTFWGCDSSGKNLDDVNDGRELAGLDISLHFIEN